MPSEIVKQDAQQNFDPSLGQIDSTMSILDPTAPLGAEGAAPALPAPALPTTHAPRATPTAKPRRRGPSMPKLFKASHSAPDSPKKYPNGVPPPIKIRFPPVSDAQTGTPIPKSSRLAESKIPIRYINQVRRTPKRHPWNRQAFQPAHRYGRPQ